MKQQEEERMRQEAEAYENYRRHLEEKKRSHYYDSDDYASEWDSVPEEEDELPVQEKFTELRAQRKVHP
ncbi:hypothetical protein E2C01_019930 [Portunus trituberculatus]|uniref:Uncharacterized protein n=1 Tax=Portunus trituberculatus TaxID=210409 RepID=A0A5B7DYK4_PORTR|nr:hypothetical protein [Portunus trituberculatus]